MSPEVELDKSNFSNFELCETLSEFPNSNISFMISVLRVHSFDKVLPSLIQIVLIHKLSLLLSLNDKRKLIS